MPAEEIAEVFLEVIEGGKSVSESAKIIQFVADNGAAIAEGITETAAAGNGVAAEVTAVTETAAATGAATTTGLGLLAVDVGVAGAAIAPALGILAGVGLYNLAPEFWTNVSNTLLEAGQTIGGKVHALLTNDGRVAYSQDTIEIFKQAFKEAKLFDASGTAQKPESGSYPSQSTLVEPFPFVEGEVTQCIYAKFDSSASNARYRIRTVVAPGVRFLIPDPSKVVNKRYSADCIMVSDAPFTIQVIIRTYNGLGELTYTDTSSENITSGYTYAGKTVYCSFYNTLVSKSDVDELLGLDLFLSMCSAPFALFADGNYHNVSHYYQAVAWLMWWGLSQISKYTQDGATLPTTDPFPQTYPNWQPITVPESLPQPNYYPVEVPYVLPEQEAAQDPVSQPEVDPDPWVRWIIENLPIPEPNPDPYPEPGPAPEPDPDPQPDPEPAPEPDPEPVEPNPPDPNQPVEPDPVPFIPPILDTVNSTKIFTVYNPTSAELDALGGYLWSTDVLETIVKIWQNPLDGVISLRQVYCTPVSGGSHNIILGSLDSGVSAAIVTSQFTTIDCGSVTIGEKNKNVTDYSPYATVHLYLPFIGIVQLDVDEVMNSTLNVKYTIDVYTGTCLAEVYVTRDPDMTVSKILYTFSGNCSQTLPLTASDATGLASTLASLGAAAIGIVAGGGALGAVAGASMVGHSLTHEMINIGHSGSLSSNAGIMGQRKPYVIIGRRHGYDANSYNEIYGYPTNKTVFLGNCDGFVRVKAINLQSAATEEEKKEIMQLLKQGVIM